MPTTIFLGHLQVVSYIRQLQAAAVDAQLRRFKSKKSAAKVHTEMEKRFDIEQVGENSIKSNKKMLKMFIFEKSPFSSRPKKIMP